MIVNGMHGLGDNIYQRAFIREIAERVYLRTSWPQIYSDLPNVRPVKTNIRLRTQAKNVARQIDSVWHQAPALPVKRIKYNNASFKKGSILDAMRNCFGNVKPKVFDLPVFDGPEIFKPYAVIRPVSVRMEWCNIARNPEPEYIYRAAEILKSRGFLIVSVADLQDDAELTDMLPPCDLAYNHGELFFDQLIGLVRNASLVVGGVGWIVPAAIAAGVPLITILGGHGAHNAPEKITGPPMDLSKTRWIYPDNFCRCSNMLHLCDKEIHSFEYKFEEALAALWKEPFSKTP